jgi:hypothetical protein
MGDRLAALHAEYDNDNQDTKRAIGEYLYNHPVEWVSQQAIASEFEPDVSGISKHLDDFHDDGYIHSTIRDDGQRYVQWDGRGAGGITYWSNQVLPRHLWEAGNEIRPLLTLDRLGGAYLPTILFGVLMVVGVVLGTVTVLIYYLDVRPFYGWTIPDLLILTGYLTMAASLFLVAAVLWRGFIWVMSVVGVLKMINGWEDGE